MKGAKLPSTWLPALGKLGNPGDTVRTQSSSFCSAGPCTPAITNAVMPDLDLLSLLPGFILALSADGKLAYISENITQILGFSVVSSFL